MIWNGLRLTSHHLPLFRRRDKGVHGQRQFQQNFTSTRRPIGLYAGFTRVKLPAETEIKADTGLYAGFTERVKQLPAEIEIKAHADTEIEIKAHTDSTVDAEKHTRKGASIQAKGLVRQGCGEEQERDRTSQEDDMRKGGDDAGGPLEVAVHERSR